MLNGQELLDFIFGRKSFYKDYKLFHNLEEDRVKERIDFILSHADLKELDSELRVCFSAALQSGIRKTYFFNRYVIDLLELYFSNLDFSSRKEEMLENHHPIYDDTHNISYAWVLFSNLLTVYQRYLVFEYLMLGYNIEDLARRRHCTARTIYNHLDQIVEVLNPEDLPLSLRDREVKTNHLAD